MCGVLLNGGSNKCIYVTVSLPLSKEVFINSSGLVFFSFCQDIYGRPEQCSETTKHGISGVSYIGQKELSLVVNHLINDNGSL